MNEGKCCCVRCGKETFRHLLDGHVSCLVVHRVANRADLVANESVVVANKPAELVANRHGKYRDLARRREYMRVLMARRRAEKRSGL